MQSPFQWIRICSPLFWKSCTKSLTNAPCLELYNNNNNNDNFQLLYARLMVPIVGYVKGKDVFDRSPSVHAWRSLVISEKKTVNT